MATPVRVKKWGSSMAVLIPSQFARLRKIAVGTVIDIEPVRVVGGGRRRYRLSDLMAGFKRRHRYEEWKLGAAVGNEVW